MTDTLIVLPTIGANVEKAKSTLASLRGFGASDYDFPHEVMLIIDDPDPDLSEYSIGGVNIIQKDVSRERRGLVAAYRAGFTHFLVGRWSHLVLLEDNLRLSAGWHQAMRRTLDAHPEFGWVACGQLENDAAPFTSLCSMLTRECALALDGGPDLAFAPCQFDDGDMFMRALKAGFRPHAVPHKVSHPEARTSRVGTIEDDWQLIEAHRAIFRYRWGLYDFPWAAVPVHRGCGECRG